MSLGDTKEAQRRTGRSRQPGALPGRHHHHDTRSRLHQARRPSSSPTLTLTANITTIASTRSSCTPGSGSSPPGWPPPALSPFAFSPLASLSHALQPPLFASVFATVTMRPIDASQGCGHPSRRHP